MNSLVSEKAAMAKKIKNSRIKKAEPKKVKAKRKA